MLIQTGLPIALYTPRTALRPRQGAAQTSRPALKISGSDLGGPRPGPAQEKSEDWGMGAFCAHSIFRSIPARMSLRARDKYVETCSPGHEMPCTWRPAGKYEGLCDLSARWRASCTTVYIVFLSASHAEQRQSGRGEGKEGRAARADADVARDEHKTEDEDVELTAIKLYLHLAGLELRGGRCAAGASPALAHIPKVPVVTRHVYAVVSRCCAFVVEEKTGFLHCSRPGEDSEVGGDAPRPPPARGNHSIF